MKITKSQLKRLIKEELTEMAGTDENYPKARQLLGDETFERAMAQMKVLRAKDNRGHEMMGGRSPYPRDETLFLRALESVLKGTQE